MAEARAGGLQTLVITADSIFYGNQGNLSKNRIPANMTIQTCTLVSLLKTEVTVKKRCDRIEKGPADNAPTIATNPKSRPDFGNLNPEELGGQ
jgi:hypothetical protein